ncbi:MAG: tsaD, partial [Burkholderiales bacterium]|nr:tsaD [Burkholderiales bacterium]
SANLTLRTKMSKIVNGKVFYPPLDLCTDNGAMIAIAGFYRFKNAKFDYSFSVSPRYDLIKQ